MRINFKNTNCLFSFKSKNQLALFEISKEYYNDDQMDFAKIIFQIKGREFKRKTKEFLNSLNSK